MKVIFIVALIIAAVVTCACIGNNPMKTVNGYEITTLSETYLDGTYTIRGEIRNPGITSDVFIIVTYRDGLDKPIGSSFVKIGSLNGGETKSFITSTQNVSIAKSTHHVSFIAGSYTE